MELSVRVLAADGPGGRILKVNHAGENGAVHIYNGQILVGRLTAPSMVAQLRHFRTHEESHRRVFETELQRRGVRRCRSYVLCGIGGFALGAVTALFGRGAIAATTVAVERVVLSHLKHQLAVLEDRDPKAAEAVRTIVSEEQEHHDTAAMHAANASGFWLAVLAPLVSVATELVIWTGMRL
jgi:ubiquinone biosynthesis monooxygenase Coq7